MTKPPGLPNYEISLEFKHFCTVHYFVFTLDFWIFGDLVTTSAITPDMNEIGLNRTGPEGWKCVESRLDILNIKLYFKFI